MELFWLKHLPERKTQKYREGKFCILAVDSILPDSLATEQALFLLVVLDSMRHWTVDKLQQYNKMNNFIKYNTWGNIFGGYLRFSHLCVFLGAAAAQYGITSETHVY